jgi:hypothetical protein
LINQYQNEGYDIFVVKGNLPFSEADMYAEAIPEPMMDHSMGDDEELQKAIAKSLEPSVQPSMEEMRAHRLKKLGQ